MYPIRFQPIYRDYIWGGDQIAHVFHRKDHSGRIAESWEISDRADGMSVVINGGYKGQTLHTLMLELGPKLVGQGHQFDRFPLLLKIIDAKENLSIQVHPDATIAPRFQGEPKTETWFMLKDGSVYAGIKKDVDEKRFLDSIRSNRAEETLEKLDLKKGEAAYIPSGRVHAICGGTLLYEIQQNSDTTYRLYDWGRKGRALHLKEGMASIHWHNHENAKTVQRILQQDVHHRLSLVVSSSFFVVEKLDVFDSIRLQTNPKTFQIFFCISGTDGEIIVDQNREPFQAGMTYLIPSAAQSIEINGRCEALRTRLPL